MFRTSKSYIVVLANSACVRICARRRLIAVETHGASGRRDTSSARFCHASFDSNRLLATRWPIDSQTGAVEAHFPARRARIDLKRFRRLAVRSGDADHRLPVWRRRFRILAAAPAETSAHLCPARGAFSTGGTTRQLNTHDARHLREENLHRLPNGEIFQKALAEERIILTFDLDFAEIVALSGGKAASVIVFRLRNARTSNVVARLATALNGLQQELARGAVVTVEGSRYRVRALPVARDST